MIEDVSNQSQLPYPSKTVDSHDDDLGTRINHIFLITNVHIVKFSHLCTLMVNKCHQEINVVNDCDGHEEFVINYCIEIADLVFKIKRMLFRV
jgi:hypothetical protein